MSDDALAATIEACRSLISDRFPQPGHRGAAAMLLADGTVLTGTSPEAFNSSVSVCHEIEPYCAAFRLGQPVVASVCLHRTPDGALLVLSPCGVCQERLATHGPDVLVGVPSDGDLHRVRWVRLGDVMPHYWLRAFPDEVPAWTSSTS